MSCSVRAVKQVYHVAGAGACHCEPSANLLSVQRQCNAPFPKPGPSPVYSVPAMPMLLSDAV